MSSSASPTASCWSSSVRTVSRCSVNLRCVPKKKKERKLNLLACKDLLGAKTCFPKPWFLALLFEDCLVKCNQNVAKEEFYTLYEHEMLNRCGDAQNKPCINMSEWIQVYKACTDWVRWDMEGRAQYLHALLNAVHIYALPPKFLKNQLLSCPILSKVSDSLDWWLLVMI